MSSDAYAAVAVRGGAAPLAEAHLPCCVIDEDTLACATCAQALTQAVADVSCGAAATILDDTLTTAGQGGEYIGAFGSSAHVEALSTIAHSVHTATPAVSLISNGLQALANPDPDPNPYPNPNPNPNGLQALAALQAEDDEALSHPASHP